MVGAGFCVAALLGKIIAPGFRASFGYALGLSIVFCAEYLERRGDK